MAQQRSSTLVSFQASMIASSRCIWIPSNNAYSCSTTDPIAEGFPKVSLWVQLPMRTNCIPSWASWRGYLLFGDKQVQWLISYAIICFIRSSRRTDLQSIPVYLVPFKIHVTDQWQMVHANGCWQVMQHFDTYKKIDLIVPSELCLRYEAPKSNIEEEQET